MVQLVVVFLLLVVFQITQSEPTYNWSDEWGNCERVNIFGYDNSDTMEPFLSRDGKWLFFNSRNTGDDTSLHYSLLINSTAARYMGRLSGQANGPIPHLDAVPAMDSQGRFYWVSTRNYDTSYENLQYGVFDPVTGSIPVATPVSGDIYIRQPVWIVMDQEINNDGDLLFYVNAQFSYPPGPAPVFANISIARRNTDGTFSKFENAGNIMKTVNENVNPKEMKYAPSSWGEGATELYFTTIVPEAVVTGLFVVKRKSVDDVFGAPQRIPIPPGSYLAPEAPTISGDGNLMMFNRIDCDSAGCLNINIYKMDRIARK